MFEPFLLFAAIIVIAGPMENEGGRAAVQEDGFKNTVKAALHNTEPVDYAIMND